MIDIHCHILPNVDDGPRSLEQSLEMARQAVQSGIHTVIATPHHANGYMTNRHQITDEVEQLQQQLREHSIPLHILPGQEIRVYEDLLYDLEKGNLHTLNDSRYILIEFPSGSVPHSFDELLHELRLLDKIPIIAHPERNSVLINDQDYLSQMIADGALTQLTSASLCGKLGRKLQKQCLSMIKSGMVHFIASDAHDVERRSFDLSEGYMKIEKELGIQYTDYFLNNAADLIRDLPLTTELPLPKRKVFQLW